VLRRDPKERDTVRWETQGMPTLQIVVDGSGRSKSSSAVLGKQRITTETLLVTGNAL
jgi:hypothetical protein